MSAPGTPRRRRAADAAETKRAADAGKQPADAGKQPADAAETKRAADAGEPTPAGRTGAGGEASDTRGA